MPTSFQLTSAYTPRGDQGKAIAGLSAGLRAGDRMQTLLGVTGSGKTFTMAGIIEELQRPAIVIAHPPVAGRVHWGWLLSLGAHSLPGASNRFGARRRYPSSARRRSRSRLARSSAWASPWLSCSR